MAIGAASNLAFMSIIVTFKGAGQCYTDYGDKRCAPKQMFVSKYKLGTQNHLHQDHTQVPYLMKTNKN